MDKGAGNLVIHRISPRAGIEGGKVYVECTGFDTQNFSQSFLYFGDHPTRITVATPSYVIAPIPRQAQSGPVRMVVDGETSNPVYFEVGTRLATNLHPVCNPALDASGNIYVTLSGTRGQKVPVSIYRITPAGVVEPFVSDIINPSGLAFDRQGDLYVTSRYNGTVYRVSPSGKVTTFCTNLGVATGVAFDQEEHLYVGDRNGTIYRITREGICYPFATIEPSVAAFHLAFDQQGYLYVTSPTMCGYDPIYRLSPDGDVEIFFTDLGRPQGMAFDIEGNLYVVAYYQGQSGIIKISPTQEVEHVLSGLNLVGLALDGIGNMIVVDTASVYRLPLGIIGRPLP
ncbi:MAG: gluconolaconase [Nitrospinota bacterium]|nr:MAG: gluconolaconase [Nitrospinota bacterium]